LVPVGEIKYLFNHTTGRNDNNTQVIKRILSRNVYALTVTQRTAEWFLFRGIHLNATMASRISNSTTEVEEGRILQMLIHSWLSRSRSTEEMRIGTKNEDAILAAFHNFSIVTDIFQSGLLESKFIPWLAASLDAPEGQKVLATIEVKMRVSPERVAEAERIAACWNHKMLVCLVGTDNIEDIMDKEHATQVMIQMATCNLNWAIYIEGQPGTSNTHGCIIYIAMIYASEDVMEEFLTSVMKMFETILSPFYMATNVDDLQEHLPESLTTDDVNLIRSRWPFFKLARSYIVPNMYYGFPSCSVMKTAIQTLYNTLKGGLDSNSQQFQAILPLIKTGFEQKYVICLLISIVTNTWRAQQLLQQQIKPGSGFSLHSYRKLLVTQSVLDTERFQLQTCNGFDSKLYRSVLPNVLVANNNQNPARGQNEMSMDARLGIVRDPSTLALRINDEMMPKRQLYCGFTKRKNLLELRLTENDEFQHMLNKTNRTKMHCALCIQGKTMYSCTVCKVALCKTAKDKSHWHENCSTIWHKQQTCRSHHRTSQSKGSI
jgi:hypothetical protein